MKNVFILFIALCISTALFSQKDSNSGMINNDDLEDEFDGSYHFDDHQFYITLGPSIPLGNWIETLDPRAGFAVDLGMTYYLKRLNADLDGFGFGIDWNILDLSVNRYNNDVLKGNYVSIGSEIGPLGSINLTDDLNIDIFYHITGALKFVGFRDGIGDGVEADVFFGWKHSVGSNLRFRAMKVSLEADLGKLRLISDDNISDFRTGFNALEIKFGFSI